MNDNQRMASLLFPDGTADVADLLQRYPARNLPEGAMVTRLAPSPTGELHIGTLYAAFLSYRLAMQTGGVFYLRLDDTDTKRETAGSRDRIPAQIRQFGVDYQEGFMGSDEERGAYGPYAQTARGPIYHAFAAALVAAGMAYPCFCTEAALTDLRKAQKTAGVDLGYYGAWAKHRDMPFEDAKRRIQEGVPYVLRFRSPGKAGRRVVLEDLVKGRVAFPENVHDVVLLKTDGLPTYHFAHAVDDLLMRTTHAFRGDEWLSSVPIHLQLFAALGHPAPVYGHLAPIMKKEGESKRKFSKRRDADGHVSFYGAQGIPSAALLEYYMGLINSGYEDWRRAHPMQPVDAYPIDIRKLSVSGAVFDMQKLDHIARNVIAQMDVETELAQLLAWAGEYAPTLADVLREDMAYTRAVLCIGKETPNPRKDIGRWSDVQTVFGYFWDALLALGSDDCLQAPAAQRLLRGYHAAYDAGLDKPAWYAQMKAVAVIAGYAPGKQTLRDDPSAYAGGMAEAAAVLRYALTGRETAPDLYDIMQVMGHERVLRRLSAAIRV